jgi:hypothetical protein
MTANRERQETMAYTRIAGRGCSLAFVSILVLASCDVPVTPSPRAAVASAETAIVCSDYDYGAHGKHTARYACATCHPCGYGLEIATITLPNGSTTAGSVVTRGEPTTCTTVCHHPYGATPQPVRWIAGGLPCTECHTNVAAPSGMTVVSAHPGLMEGGTACTSCHDTSAHTSGVVRLIGFSSGGNACQSCHSGTGGTLLGETPPLLVDWTGDYGDRHGETAGTGYGGTLLAPYQRQQSAMACTTCHVAHVSGNPYLLAPKVNNFPIPAGQIQRSGIGAEQLCESCHAGARHARCAQCHVTDPKPAGTACFACHAHERAFLVLPSGSPGDYHDNSQITGTCKHCHDSGWSGSIVDTLAVILDDVEFDPPIILDNERITVTSGDEQATVVWHTDERASSFVEYGAGEGVRGLVSGNAARTTAHVVTLTGLTNNTEYSFRVRSYDAMRNVTYSSVRSFQTTCSTCPAAAVPVTNANFDSDITATAETPANWWRFQDEALFCGRWASTEMTGPNVLRIAARPKDYYDDETGEYFEYGGWGTASYLFTRAALDQGTNLTFDVRLKVYGMNSAVTLALAAYDASGALISNVTNDRHVAPLVGYSSPYGYQGLKIAPVAVNTTYARSLNIRNLVLNNIQAGKSWSDVAKVVMTLQATSGPSGSGIDVYFDNFR